ncbi:hypothetical protein ABKV19_008172 [Rosa sericea]
MNSIQWSMITALMIIFLLPYLPSCISIDSITPNQTIKDGDVLVSSKKLFALGFFSPGNSGKRYVGVWFNKVPDQPIVWVANRDNPINDSSGLLVIDADGGLVIYGKDRKLPLWSATVTLSYPKNSMAKLLDTGNFVLFENGRSLWEGFDYPSNTMLPFMKIGLNRRSGLNRFLTSWKSQDDPGTGNFSARIDPDGFPQMFLYKGQAPRWRIGSWIGHRWSGVPIMDGIKFDSIFDVRFVNDQDELYVMDRIKDDSIFSRMVLVESGILERSMWQDQQHQWSKYWSGPVELCDNYGECGPNSNCDPYAYNDGMFECACLPGFEPKLNHSWYLKDGSGGCVRKKGASVCKTGEGFVKVSPVKAPDSSTAHVNLTLGPKECEEECLRDCSCMAYSSASGQQERNGCVTWYGDLMDTRTYTSVTQELYVRVDSIELAKHARKSNGSFRKKGKLAITITSILVFFLVISIAYWSVKKRKGKERQNPHPFGVITPSIYLEDSASRTDPDGSRLKSDIPFFDLSTISAATNNFSDSNRLGEGGFGPVYKGVLSSGTEIAVKRLSKNSGQGNEEFKNEVVLIAKLQHRNLVRILGYCVQDEEKMLIYEYLPNKSLDSFIFNEMKRTSLDWTRRLEIIFGIARGILYLHQDSRLRIIHRDLKASNILLDYDMNPKIADFGVARIFGANQIAANTNRVVGT